MTQGSRDVTSRKEKVGYALGDAACNLYWKSAELFLLFFYTEVFGLSAAQAGTMFGVTRIFDAISDPVMGLIADRTLTADGRFRPYLRWFALPMAVAGVLTFTTPDLAPGAKLVYAYVTYTLMLIVYTAINIPYSALMGVMSPNPEERTRISSYRFAGAFVGTLAVQLSTLELVTILGQDDAAAGWQRTMVLFGVVAVAMFWACFRSTRERVAVLLLSTSSRGLRPALRALRRNRPWLVLMVASVLILAAFWMRGAATIYYFEYLVGDASLAASFLVVGSLASAGGIAATSPLARRLGKRNLLAGSLLGVALTYLAMLWVPPGAVMLVFVLNALANLLLGPTPPILWSMFADTVDYGEWVDGERRAGLVFSASMFAIKLGGALGGLATGWVLAFTGYAAGISQSADAKLGILLLFTALPAGAFAAAAFVTRRGYPLQTTLLEQIERELEQRRR
ncbi:MAG: MFS transporter [Myxococcota bacterium]